MAAVPFLEASWEDYLALGEDVRAEYIDGSIVMSPFPSRKHQTACRRLANLMEADLPEGYDVVIEWGWKPGDDEFGPDVMVFPTTDEEVRFTGTPLLCVEVLSTNRAADLVVKAAKYAAAGVDHYWVVDTADETLTAFVREGDAYRLALVIENSAPQRVAYGAGEVTIDTGALFR
ncbi:Uma2 family endonuclease [uncultured Friedmanniella sp.]|uniref:Uma2 family endonuclease n=1 Tax=uncultured Friedmanniella sp. TaxID=335381 RepID=UPI0035CABD1E